MLGILCQPHLLLIGESFDSCLQDFILNRHLEKVSLSLRTFLPQLNKLLVIVLDQATKTLKLLIVCADCSFHVRLQLLRVLLKSLQL